jgi:type I restriction enzyme M protein
VKALTYPDLVKGVNLVGILFNLANVMRSHSINEPQLRYKETVKLLLARYCDEKEGMEASDEPLSLQVFLGTDPKFMERLTALYRTAANRYSKAQSLFNPVAVSELPERALRDIVRSIQGIEFSSASNETMQQVFMSFVPAVFKKNLDQYFTPISLIQAVVQMAKIGPNDKVADPGMGTGDFLTAAMEYRARLGDKDIDKRLVGIDSDLFAFDLAIINMILNKDGQTGLHNEDSIEHYSHFAEEMGVVLCNPPFGERSIENRAAVLKEYDLGHRWEYDASNLTWTKTDDLLPSQQLGILFIERCYKMLANKGRLGIILPEGYLCTPTYGYVRRWILDHLRILSLTELPRRIFVKSGVDLRSNILIAQKLSAETIAKLVVDDYPIHADMVRKVGFKMGKGNQSLYIRDSETGEEVRDEQNDKIPDSDFHRVCAGFDSFTAASQWDRRLHVVGSAWAAARVNDINRHANLDMKPRRLMPRALDNVNKVKAAPHKRLDELADVVEETINILETGGTGQEVAPCRRSGHPRGRGGSRSGAPKSRVADCGTEDEATLPPSTGGHCRRFGPPRAPQYRYALGVRR